MNVKKVIAVLASAVVFTSALGSAVCAAPGEFVTLIDSSVGGNVTYSYEQVDVNPRVILASAEQTVTAVTIKSDVSNLEIGDYAFSGKNTEGCDLLTDLTIPDNVVSIGAYAFYNCDGLTSVTIGAGVTSIGQFAFAGCTNLASITVAEGNANFFSSNGMLYAADGTLLVCPAALDASVVGASAIGAYAFIGNTATDVVIANGATSIGIYAFYDSAVQKVTIPATVTAIGYNAIPAGTVIAGIAGSYAETYAAANGYTFEAVLPSINGFTYAIADGAATITGFTDELTGDIAIPAEIEGAPVTAIAPYAFSGKLETGNQNITSVVIPESVTKIGAYAFYNCANITSATIGSGVNTIGQFAFYGCTALNTIDVADGNTTFSSNDGVLLNAAGNTVITVPAGRLDVSIPAGVTTIASYAFAGTSVSSVVVPTGVTSIGIYAFYDSAILDITVPATVDSIGIDAIDSDVIISGYNATAADTYAAANGNVFISLDVVSIFTYEIVDGGVVITGLSADATGDIVVPATIEGLPVVAIADYAFAGKTEAGNDAITSIVLPDSVASIGSYAFEGCEALVAIDLGSGITSIEQFAFYGCSALESITVSSADFSDVNGVIFTDNGATLFYVPEACGSVAINEAVTAIAPYAFVGNNVITSLELPVGVQNIGIYAFYESALADITVYGTETAIAYDAIPANVVISGYTGTPAETYAAENGNTFVALDAADYLYGDANNDTFVNAFDALYILQYASYIVDLDDVQFVQADVDGSGDVTPFDALLVLQYNSFIIDSFPCEA